MDDTVMCQTTVFTTVQYTGKAVKDTGKAVKDTGKAEKIYAMSVHITLYESKIP
jgi:hypothetical protein